MEKLQERGSFSVSREWSPVDKRKKLKISLTYQHALPRNWDNTEAETVYHENQQDGKRSLLGDCQFGHVGRSHAYVVSWPASIIGEWLDCSLYQVLDFYKKSQWQTYKCISNRWIYNQVVTWKDAVKDYISYWDLELLNESIFSLNWMQIC
jgi:hypothetical protein